jgi:cell division protein FtsB
VFERRVELKKEELARLEQKKEDLRGQINSLKNQQVRNII